MQRRIPLAASFERFAFVVAGLSLLCVRAGATDGQAPVTSPALAARSTNAPVTEIAPGVFQIGGVRLNQNEKSLTLPVALNMTNGLIEYLLVTPTGKVHESLLTTDIEPYHLQAAMLLLGAKGAQWPPLTSPPPGGPVVGSTLTEAVAKPFPGNPVRVEVQWPRGLTQKRLRIERLVLDRKAGAPMSEGDFTFTGSRSWNGTFIAQRDGSIISTVADADAMFDNPRPGRSDDENWRIIPTELPPFGTAMQVTITLESAPHKKP